MSKLKSLKDFKAEGNALNSDELKNITGGKTVYFWVVTTKVENDRLKMAQHFIWNGSEYIHDGPPYSTGEMTIYTP